MQHSLGLLLYHQYLSTQISAPIGACFFAPSPYLQLSTTSEHNTVPDALPSQTLSPDNRMSSRQGNRKS